MRERDFYSPLTKYYEQNATNSMAWEAKLSKTDRLPFSSLAPHQETKLLKATAVHGEKIPDIGLAQKSFDGFTLYRATAVVIAIYFKPRATEIYEIDIRKWIVEAYGSKEKSLTRARAAEIGTRIDFTAGP